MTDKAAPDSTARAMSLPIAEINDRLASEQSIGGGEFEALRRELAALPLSQRRDLLRSLARHGERAIPLFELLARDPLADLAVLGMDLLAWVRSPQAARALEGLAARAATKDLRKEARRALHRLHAAGIRPAEAPIPAEPTAGPGPRRPEDRLYRAHASSYDGSGVRSLRIVAEMLGGGLAVVLILAHEVEGIKEVVSGEISRHDYGELAQELSTVRQILWAEVPPAYAYWLSEEFRELNRQQRRPVPKNYEIFRQAVGPPPVRYERPIVYEEISAIRVRLEPGLAERCDRLLEEPCFEGWFVEDDRLLRLARDLLAARRGLLTTAARSAQEQRDILVDRALREVFDQRHRRLYKRRLEEIGYLYQHLGQSYLARLCVAAAVNLDPVSGVPSERHPFAIALMERSLEVAADLVKQGITYADLGRDARAARQARK